MPAPKYWKRLNEKKKMAKKLELEKKNKHEKDKKLDVVVGKKGKARGGPRERAKLKSATVTVTARTAVLYSPTYLNMILSAWKHGAIGLLQLRMVARVWNKVILKLPKKSWLSWVPPLSQRIFVVFGWRTPWTTAFSAFLWNERHARRGMLQNYPSARNRRVFKKKSKWIYEKIAEIRQSNRYLE